jgi:hypothetical protein
MIRTYTRFTAWLLLVACQVTQLAASLGSEPFVTLNANQYRISTTEPVSGLGKVQIAIREDLYAPVPLAWLSLASLMSISIILTVKPPMRAGSPGDGGRNGKSADDARVLEKP